MRQRASTAKKKYKSTTCKHLFKKAQNNKIIAHVCLFPGGVPNHVASFSYSRADLAQTALFWQRRIKGQQWAESHVDIVEAPVTAEHPSVQDVVAAEQPEARAPILWWAELVCSNRDNFRRCFSTANIKPQYTYQPLRLHGFCIPVFGWVLAHPMPPPTPHHHYSPTLPCRSHILLLPFRRPPTFNPHYSIYRLDSRQHQPSFPEGAHWRRILRRLAT